MQVIHRGLVIQLLEGDARIVEVERLLFGGPLPIPVPPPPPPPPPPRVEVPAAVREWWKALPAEDRAEIVALLEGPIDARALELRLGVTENLLRGRHARLAREGRKQGVETPIAPVGRLRADRRYRLKAPFVPWIRELLKDDTAR